MNPDRYSEDAYPEPMQEIPEWQAFRDLVGQVGFGCIEGYFRDAEEAQGENLQGCAAGDVGDPWSIVVDDDRIDFRQGDETHVISREDADLILLDILLGSQAQGEV
ncbi:MAG TPA: hypothetical protein VK674_00335 [Candidatus Limnocylindria bacterium]|nr:hypothetical protein [Candidatus Limnocylindria bacterium]